MATGTKTYMGLALPAYGEATMTQTTAADDLLTLQGAASGAGQLLASVLSGGTTGFGITKNGNPILRRYTTRPTTGLTKNELLLIYHGSTPKLGICFSTATSATKLIRARTKTIGRLTA